MAKKGFNCFAQVLICIIGGFLAPMDLSAQNASNPTQAEPQQDMKASTANPAVPARDLHELVAGNTRFATALYGKLRQEKTNFCFSPYSISVGISMAYAGARGETEKQMAETLHFSLPPDKVFAGIAALEANFREVRERGQIKLEVANSLWPQKGAAFLPDYVDLCQTWFGAPVQPVDYVEDTEGARKSINDWVEDKTHQKIVELLKPGMVGPGTRLVLVDAIYFKGDWASQFKAALTRDETFHLSPETSVTTALMRQTNNFRYAESANLQALEMPYEGGQLSMVILLPRQVDGLGELEADLTPPNLASWIQNLRSQKVEVFLPKFKLTSEYRLGKTLATLGMPAAFDRSADFSGMNGQRDFHISDVIHKAFIEVNEQGAEAAAATATIMLGRAAPRRQPPPVFRADHPFVYLIRNNQNGSILFLGRMANPNE